MADTSSTNQTAAPASTTLTDTLGAPKGRSVADVVRQHFERNNLGDGGKPIAPGKAAPSSAAPAGEQKPAEGSQRAADGKFEKSEATKTKEQVQREENALKGLARAKYPQSAIDRMSDDERIEVGLAFFESQRAGDRESSQKGKQKESDRAEAPKKGAQPQEKVDNLLKRDVSALADVLDLDEDGVEGLSSFAQRISTAATQRAIEAEQAVADMQEQLGQYVLKTELARLAGQYQELSDPAVLAEVTATANRLSESDEYDDLPFAERVSRVSEDAVWRVCRASIQARRASADAADSAAKNAGQVRAGSRQGDGGLKPMHPLEYAASIRDPATGMTGQRLREAVNAKYLH